MPLDEQVGGLLAGMKSAGMKSFELLTIDEFRGSFAGIPGMQRPPEPVANVHDVLIPGPAGNLPAKVYVPKGQQPFPVLVYFHGGGWIGGGLAVVDEPCRALANEVGAIVVAATYRLAPENKFPSAADDAYAATSWAASNAARFGGDATKIFVMGDSAGGNLAASVALMARDRGAPKLAGQALLYPVVDTENAYPSAKEYAAGYFLDTTAVAWLWSQYLRDSADKQNPYACPMRSSPAGLPPTLILTAECDPTRDQAEAYGAQLAKAGVNARVKRVAGLIHGTFWMSGAVPRAKEFYKDVADFIKRTA